MACPLCGERCTCSYVARFSDDAAPAGNTVLVDPESWDDTEEQFAASMADGPVHGATQTYAAASRQSSRPATAQVEEQPSLTGIERAAHEIRRVKYQGIPLDGEAASAVAAPAIQDEAWRDEVA